jgi:hypothetical protein
MTIFRQGLKEVGYVEGRGCLRAGSKRHCGCATAPRDELPPSHLLSLENDL